MYLITHEYCVNCDIQNIAAQWSAFFFLKIGYFIEIDVLIKRSNN